MQRRTVEEAFIILPISVQGKLIPSEVHRAGIYSFSIHS